MFRLCQTANAHPCGEVKLKLEATGTFWMTPYCSCKVSQVPRWVWTAEYYLYMRWKCNGIQIRESTNWYAHSPLKDLGNANRRKCERKIEGFFFLLSPPYPSNPGSTDHRHCGSTDRRLFRTWMSYRTFYYSPHLLTQGRSRCAPKLTHIPVTRRYRDFCYTRILIQELEEAPKHTFHGC